MKRKRDTRAMGMVSIVMLCVGSLLSSAMAEGPDGPDAQMQSAAAAPGEASQESQPTSSAHPLAGTAWQLVQFQSMDDAVGTARPDDPARYTMRLENDGSVTMKLNCNRAQGTWSAQESGDGSSGAFAFGQLAATDVKCSSAGMDRHVATLAGYIRSYLLRDGRLHLSLMADGGIYTWEPIAGYEAGGAVPASPEKGGPRNWEVREISGRLNLRAEPSTSSGIVAAYASGAILDNLGCRRAEGRIWCDVQQLGGGLRGYVAAEFLRPAISPDGSAASGPDDSALRAGKGEFDATGKVPCAQLPGQPMMQCKFGVARSGGGYASVVVERPTGASRTIYFRMGKAVGADTSEADGSNTFRVSRESDLHNIRVGSERYEIPDAVVLGG